MEIIPSTAKRTDNSLLMITHLSQLLYYVTGFGGLLVPLILWLSQKDQVEGMNEHGKSVINFQLTLILITILSFPALILFGLGILGFIYVGIVGFVMPIVNAIKANNGEAPSYFGTIRFIS